LDQRVHQAFAVAASRPSGEAGLMIVTHVDVPPPRRDETEALLQSAVEQARNQQGNTRFDIFQQKAPRTNHFTLVAGWSREDAFAQHEGDARTRQFREALAPMLGALYDERVYRALD
jgi:quinol monooxygenase YgiN